MLRAPHRLRIGRLSRGGELGRTEAWLGDKLKVEGDTIILMWLEGLISKAWGENGNLWIYRENLKSRFVFTKHG